MAKVTIELNDTDNDVTVETTVSGYSDDSNACKMTERIISFVDRIAERKVVPQLVQVAQQPSARRVASLSHLASKSVIIHA